MIYQGMHIENYTDSEIIDEALKSADILTQNIGQRYMNVKTLDDEDRWSFEILENENNELKTELSEQEVEIEKLKEKISELELELEIKNEVIRDLEEANREGVE